MAERHTRRGGQELPPELQDRPEQNEGYDQAVRGGNADTPLGRDDLNAVEPPDDVPVEDEDEPDTAALDDRAERGAAADVRRRERRR